MRWCFSCAILVLGFLVVVMFWCFVLAFLCWCSSGVFVRSLGCLRSSGRKTQPGGKLSKMKFEHIRREDRIRSKNLSLTKEGSPYHFSAQKDKQKHCAFFERHLNQLSEPSGCAKCSKVHPPPASRLVPTGSLVPCNTSSPMPNDLRSTETSAIGECQGMLNCSYDLNAKCLLPVLLYFIQLKLVKLK